MAEFFPRKSIRWQLEEPGALRRFSLKLVPMALVTGIVLRLFRAALLGSLTPSWGALGAYYGVAGAVFVAAMTAHVGNFPLRQWLWRVPAFAVAEVAVESLVSLGLIALGREPFGTVRATMADWWDLTLSGFWYRMGLALVFGALLAGIVQGVRYVLLKREEREAMDVEGDRETGALLQADVDKALADQP
jgi:hypothetical protein